MKQKQSEEFFTLPTHWNDPFIFYTYVSKIYVNKVVPGFGISKS